ncbi:hypothetical protein DSM112329_04385 [Paraconexibacter sp. AEG42_29]|uniref:Uncharacterized protein n=1 Tax=Paraconexibacter sp. AEG42_29 TaxID=2997339 RepID=A0AAU7B1A2_9ACTN
MTEPPVASATDLEQELRRQSAALHAALAATQDALTVEQEQLATSRDEVRRLEADLVAVRAHLADARRELQWLRRAGVDLNALMEHRLIRAVRAAGRLARRPLSLVRRRPS